MEKFVTEIGSLENNSGMQLNLRVIFLLLIILFLISIIVTKRADTVMHFMCSIVQLKIVC
eukprot:m.106645 g.106645  ORF g.106645 m.106645 type:complete len:60 (+) comp12677_c0_seq2:1159-1338(+)